MIKAWGLLLVLVLSIIVYFWGKQISAAEALAWAHLLKDHPLKLPVFILVTMAVCFINIPLGVITKVLSGWLFGFQFGFVISYFTILFGSWLAFRLSRFLGREFVEKYWFNSMKKIDSKISGNELLTLIQLRIFPFFPLPFTNYALGVTNATNLKFILSGAIGMLPATIFYSSIGAHLNELTAETLNMAHFYPYYIYIIAAIVVSLSLSFFKKKKT